MAFLRFILHLLVIAFLTVLTQVGGIVYLLSVLLIKRKRYQHRAKRIALFVVLYLIATLLVIPQLAPIFGREKIKESDLVSAHNVFTKLTNRNYVRPKMNLAMSNIAGNLAQKHDGTKLVYLDANFPFIDRFPLLPHLSHDDGKKIDVSLIYEDHKGITNMKPTVSGYGYFTEPQSGEHDQIKACLDKGYKQYDYSKYTTLGTIRKNLKFSETATRDLILEIAERPEVDKIFIEPHLKTRLGLESDKIRFHGCRAVRHDDHIHFQLK